MTSNVLNLLKTNYLVVPNILLKYKDRLKINEKEIIFLSYLMSFKESISFNLNKIANDLYLKQDEVMIIFSSLAEKNLVNMIVDKDSGIIKEYISIDSLYDKILSFVIEKEDKEEKTNDENKVYEKIENEFGRTLSPIEYEIIKGWLDSNISEELILEALKEAVFNGVNNLKYIDRILFEWTKKGYNKKKDVKRKIQKEDKNEDVFDYDWLEDNE